MKFALSSLAVAVALAAAAGASASRTSEVLVIPDGEFASHDGRPASVKEVDGRFKKWRLTPEGGARIVALHARYGRDIQVDYDHASESPELKAAGKAPASGWIKTALTRYEPGKGLFVTIEWTAAAAAAIDAGEYKYLSPVFLYSIVNGDVFALTKVALTNDPALPLAVSALTAASAAALSRELGLPELIDPPTQTHTHQGVTMNKTLLAAALGLTADVSEETVLTAVAALAAKSKAEPDPSKYVAVATLTAEQRAHADTKAELAKLQSAQLTRDTDALIAQAKSEGVELTEAYEGHLKTVGEKLGIAALTQMVADMPRNPAKAGKTQTGDKPPKQSGQGDALDDTQTAVCSLLGISAEQFAAQRAVMVKTGVLVE